MTIKRDSEHELIMANIGKPKPVKQKKTSRKILENQLEAIIRQLVFWRDGQQCIERDFGGCGNGLQWGHFIARSQSGYLKYTLATFCQCGNHNLTHMHGAATMGVWFTKTFGVLAAQMLDAKAHEMIGKAPTMAELRERLERYDMLYQNRYYVELDTKSLVLAGYYDTIIYDAWKQENRI